MIMDVSVASRIRVLRQPGDRAFLSTATFCKGERLRIIQNPMAHLPPKCSIGRRSISWMKRIGKRRVRR